MVEPASEKEHSMNGTMEHLVDHLIEGPMIIAQMVKEVPLSNVMGYT